ncbi:M1 family aminopeptidase [Limibacter armeniacum]|uniref:M1 family metallopeptidase n=1 Tax=Limibacter armeniacum TaxID=466084 RepID=UPI002FE58AC4
MKHHILSILFLSVMFFTSCDSANNTLQNNEKLVSGVSKSLAEKRAAAIHDLQYNLFFNIPASPDEPIDASVTIKGKTDTNFPLILDFREDPSKIKEVLNNGKPVKYRFEKGHIILKQSSKEINLTIKFEAGTSSLNRNEDFLYTLLVPDRASTVFPCFDQPDLKAVFKLSLEVPQNWEVLSGGNIETQSSKDVTNRVVYGFAPTSPVSTYLFSFVAGKFQRVSMTRRGRTIQLIHRETDKEKVRRNLSEIFNLHFKSIEWMEDYTGIAMPFQKLDCAIIPSFQYGGMEHIGAIQYRADQIFLDEAPPQQKLLRRASLIAHEVTHMWFGNLVTMKWFDDVWLKEVFANFFAAKIVNPSFPNLNHDLRFLMYHQPSAYSEDRTAGSHPIQQHLDNLKDAGSLYGQIIYKKAPVVMRQLEMILGESKFRKGMIEYLRLYAYGNATWDDLIDIMDKQTNVNLYEWSAAWVKAAGMPHIRTEATMGEDGTLDSIQLVQLRTTPEHHYWQQTVKAVVFVDDQIKAVNMVINDSIQKLNLPKSIQHYDCLLPDGSGVGYGYFELDAKSRNYLLEKLHLIPVSTYRGTALLILWEEMLNNNITPQQLMDSLMLFLQKESNILNKERMLSYIHTIFWKFFNPRQRSYFAIPLETQLWISIQKASNAGEKSTFFKSYSEIAYSDKAIEKLQKIWQNELVINDLPLSERDHAELALELAVRNLKYADNILYKQLEDLSNPDYRKRFRFMIPALAKSQLTRDNFFEQLKDKANREHEPWVEEALYYLHHPLRANESRKYITPSLEMMEEIQQTGDIFFPKGWIQATLSGHSSKQAADEVRNFLEKHPDYPQSLRQKILQAADMLFRASEVKQE